MATEEIRNVTWNLGGAELSGPQASQRLFYAGFKDAKELTEMLATLYGESGWYLKAWHHNVERNDDGSIKRTDDGKLTIDSTDLGFIQKNVVHPSPAVKADSECALFAEQLFADNPELAKGDSSAKIAWQMYQVRGFQPWYAHTNGSYKKHLGVAGLAVANFLAVEFGLIPGPFDAYYKYAKS